MTFESVLRLLKKARRGEIVYTPYVSIFIGPGRIPTGCIMLDAFELLELIVNIEDIANGKPIMSREYPYTMIGEKGRTREYSLDAVGEATELIVQGCAADMHLAVRTTFVG